MLAAVRKKVMEILSGNNDWHDWEHSLRVYNNAMKFAKEENADENIVGLAALLHDVDDYKYFGKENAEKLLNARRIMQECDITEEMQNIVIQIIQNLGYSKFLEGRQSLPKEGKIVADADMLDACGIIGAVRSIIFNALKGSGKMFDREMFPRENLTKEIYQDKVREGETAVNHMFEKMLKVKELMVTASGRKEAEKRHAAMVIFLEEFFREMDVPEWQEYLEKFEKSRISSSDKNSQVA